MLSAQETYHISNGICEYPRENRLSMHNKLREDYLFYQRKVLECLPEDENRDGKCTQIWPISLTTLITTS